jgi:hypothetical protein
MPNRLTSKIRMAIQPSNPLDSRAHHNTQMVETDFQSLQLGKREVADKTEVTGEDAADMED